MSLHPYLDIFANNEKNDLLFNSVAFLLFLPAVVLVYYLLPQKYRWVWLLGASYYFYACWKVEFLSLIVFSTLVDYSIARILHKQTNAWIRRLLLVISLGANLGLLFIFKYLGLFLPDPDPMIVNIDTALHPLIGLIKQGIYFSIPVGISFYTFQTLSYTLDVFYKRVEPEKHLGKFALFVTFFPQLVAGPIERFARLMPQLEIKHTPLYRNFQQAFRLMLYGFFVKLCIADNLAPIVNAVYNNPSDFSLGSGWLGTFAFGFQIYADFAGYSLIAQGAGLCLGIQLMDNFRTPYLSSSIGEFWSRWHISLSTWFRDYLYIPLGGNRVNSLRWAINIMLVFIISGFWHGANYTFLIWGAIHGLLYLFERAGAQVLSFRKTRNGRILSGVLLFVIVNLAWVFFRIESSDKIAPHFNALLSNTGANTVDLKPELILMFFLFVFSDFTLYNKRFDTYLDRFRFPVRWSIYGVLIWCVTAWSGMANHPFIYFQF